MRRFVIVSLVFILSMISARGEDQSAINWPNYSGMVRIADNSYLVVNDLKAHKAGARLGVLTIVREGKGKKVKDKTVFQALELEKWGRPKLSDLEACCAVPGRPHEYLLAEGGQFREKASGPMGFGRLFHIRVNLTSSGKWEAKHLGVLPLPFREPNGNETWDGEQVEGIAAVPQGKTIILILGERGGEGKNGRILSQLVWGELDLEKYSFNKLGQSKLVAKSILGQRDCSDLRLERKGGNWSVWSVAVRDGGDVGPFKSVVYRAGTFVTDSASKKIRFEIEPTPSVRYVVDALKVEALAEPARLFKGAIFSIGTDDEKMGGVWRLLSR